MSRALLALAVAAAPALAHADTAMHGSLGVGGALVATGADGDRQRADVQLDLEPGGRWGRYGILVALRAFDGTHDGLLTGGLVFDAAAARPKLLLQLHVDAGVDLDVDRPLAGAGLRTTLGLVGPVGLVLDTAGYLVVDGLDGTRFEITLDALVAAHF